VKAKKWLWVGAIVLIVAGLSILGWWIYKLYNRAEHFETLYYSCMTSPVDTVIKVVEKPILSYDTLRPLPIKKWNKTVAVPDTIKKNAVFKNVEVSYYADTYKNDGVRIRYEAIVNGSLQSLRFPEIFIPERIVSIMQKVPVHDTIYTNMEKNHLGIYGKIFVNNFKTFPGLEAGFQWSIKGRGGISGGGFYNPADKNIYGVFGGFFNIN